MHSYIFYLYCNFTANLVIVRNLLYSPNFLYINKTKANLLVAFLKKYFKVTRNPRSGPGQLLKLISMATIVFLYCEY